MGGEGNGREGEEIEGECGRRTEGRKERGGEKGMRRG